MTVFNSIQIVALLACGPILLQLLRDCTFTGAGAVFWIALLAYAALFIWCICMVAEALEEYRKS